MNLVRKSRMEYVWIFGNNDFGIVVLDLEQIPEFSLCGGFIIDS